MPPGSGVPVPGANAGIEDVDVDGDVQLVGLGQRLADGVGHHRLEPAVPDLLHRVPRHALARASTRTCPAAASSRAGRPARSACRARRRTRSSRRIGCAVAGQVAVDDVGGVGVGVEVDDADVAVAVDVGDGRGRRPRDRVVAAEDDRHDAARRRPGARARGCWRASLGLAVRAVGVAEVDDLEPVEDLQAEVEVVRAGLVAAGADRPWAEAGAGPVRRRRRRTGRRRSPRRAATRRVARARSGTAAARTSTPRVRQVELLLHAGRELPSRVVSHRRNVPRSSPSECSAPSECVVCTCRPPHDSDGVLRSKRHRVARVANSSSRSITAKARSGTNSMIRFWRRKSALSLAPSVGTWRGSGRSTSPTRARRRPLGPALDRQALDGVVDGDVACGLAAQVGRLARARAAREGEALLVVVPHAPRRQGVRPAVGRRRHDPVVAPAVELGGRPRPRQRRPVVGVDAVVGHVRSLGDCGSGMATPTTSAAG